MEATLVFVAFFAAVGFMTYYLYITGQKDPKLKGLEPGVLLARVIIKYNFTYLIGLQLAALVSEAALLGSVRDLKTNVTVRMTVHVIAAAISIVGAFGMSKYWGEFFKSFMQKMPFGQRLGLISVTLILAFLSLIMAVGAPIVNMLAMANAVHNTAQFDCFQAMIQVKLGMAHPSYLAHVIAENRFPPEFSPFANLHSSMISSLIITTFHLLLVFMEIILALKLMLTREGIQHAAFGETFDVPPPKDDDKSKDDKPKDDEKDKENKKRVTDQLTAALTYTGVPDVVKWAEQILPHYLKMEDKERGPKYAALTKGVLGIEQLKDRNTTADGKNKEQLKDHLRTVLEDMANHAITLPKAKN